MTSPSHPSDAPPSYTAATSTSPNPPPDPDPPIKPLRRVSTSGPTARTTRNGIPPSHRRSMEDENRALPPGWIRQFDPQEQHQFFVDTKASPPRSIWTHPYDDPAFLATLSEDERRAHQRLARSVTLADVTAESSDEEDDDGEKGGRGHGHAGHAHGHASSSGSSSTTHAPTATHEDTPKGIHRFTRKMKDALTSSTHAERQTQRNNRAAAERAAYKTHIQARTAMLRAMQTGEPQFLCRDAQGRDVYVEPPGGPRDVVALPAGHGHGPGHGTGHGGEGPGGAGGGVGGDGGNGIRYNPYAQGPYADPNARFVRPSGPYGRPFGYGYGGGMGAPVAAGFLGGALLGGALF